jgi:hypothetical protein
MRQCEKGGSVWIGVAELGALLQPVSVERGRGVWGGRVRLGFTCWTGSKCARVDERSQMIDFEDGDDGCRSCF